MINCDVAAPVTNEIDPQVGTVTTNGNWCRSNGTLINCDVAAPVTNEIDPQVGTLTNGLWCTSNGSAVNCTSAAPLTSCGACSGSFLALTGGTISGNLTVTGTITAGVYAGGSCDVAERYQSTLESINALEPGDIIAISYNNALKVEKVNSPYNKMAIGVYSTDPLITLGDTAEAKDRNDPPVALVGRVPVKVTTENGPVKVGDLIVSSSKPGYGMSCRLKDLDLSLPEDERWQILADNERCRNAAIGKALENLESGEGRIVVFLTKGN